MEKEEILINLRSFTHAENELAIKEALHLIKVFNAIYDKEVKDYKLILNSKEEEKDSSYNPIDNEQNKEIINLINGFKKKRSAQKQKIKEQANENLSKKKIILEEFKKLIATKENIGSLISGIKKIREDWSSIGNVPREQHSETQASFSKLNDEFNYNINIYKELKENDLKINYSLKNQIIHKMNELNDEKNIKLLEKKLKTLQNQWEEIGPTFKEHWDELKTNYWNNVHSCYDKVKHFYKEQKTNQSENLIIKKQLIEEVSSLVKNKPVKHQDWEKMTNEIKSIQKKWKSTGPVPKKENEIIWDEFRSYCDLFFNAKKEFYSNRNQTQKKHADQKNKLIEKLDNILENNNFKETVNEIKKIQEEWKKIGHAGIHAEQKLWHNFRNKCDAFFENKNNETKIRKKEESESLKLKIAVVEEIKAFDIKSESAKEKLHELIENYNNTGKATYSKSKLIFDQFQDIIIKKLNALKITLEEKEEILIQLKLIQINDSFNPEKTLQNEREKIKKKINQTMKEVLNYENNLGFFKNSSGNSSILNNVTSNIEKRKKEIEKLKSELKKLIL